MQSALRVFTASASAVVLLSACEDRSTPPLAPTTPGSSDAALVDAAIGGRASDTAAPHAAALPPASASASASHVSAAPSEPAPPLPQASASSAPEPPAPIACKTVDDCWFDDDRKPAKRPANLRGRKVVPCKNGEHVPACSAGVCVVRAYKC